MSDGYQRRHESGSEKRKKKEEKEEALKKMKGSILKYINNYDKPNNDTTVATNDSITEILPNKTAKKVKQMLLMKNQNRATSPKTNSFNMMIHIQN